MSLLLFFGGLRSGNARTASQPRLLKAHVKGYIRKDGVQVADYDTKRPALPGMPGQLQVGFPAAHPAGPHVAAPAPKAPPEPVKIASAADLFGDKGPSAFQQKYGGGGFKAPQYGMSGAPKGAGNWSAQGGLFGGQSKPLGPPKAWHPQTDDSGKKVGIHHPHTATPASAWSDPAATVTLPVGAEAPADLHGVPFSSWEGAPTTLEAWEDVPGQKHDLDEPDFDCPHKLDAAAGVVIQEPDGRVWMVSPTNQFGGYKNTFPKGRADDGLSLQATAIKEAYEETGLQVEITGFLGDFSRTQTHTRVYLARRVGGSPADMGWESQALRLAPQAGWEGLLNGTADKPVREALVAHLAGASGGEVADPAAAGSASGPRTPA